MSIPRPFIVNFEKCPICWESVLMEFSNPQTSTKSELRVNRFLVIFLSIGQNVDDILVCSNSPNATDVVDTIYVEKHWNIPLSLRNACQCQKVAGGLTELQMWFFCKY